MLTLGSRRAAVLALARLGSRRAAVPALARRLSSFSPPINLGVHIVPQQSAFVVERFGKFSKVLNAGIHLLIPIVDRVAYVHMLKEVRARAPGVRPCSPRVQPPHTPRAAAWLVHCRRPFPCPRRRRSPRTT